MLIKYIATTLVVLSGTVGTSASAQYVYELRGTISSISSFDSAQQPVDLPTKLRVGQQFTFQALFDPSRYTVSPQFDDDPAVNIYNGFLQDVDFNIGGFRFFYLDPNTGPLSSGPSEVQIWDNNLVEGLAIDLFSISGIFDVTDQKYLPVDLGVGVIGLSVLNNNVDYTTTARTSDLIQDSPSLTAFGSKSASFSFINQQTLLQSTYTLSDVQSSFPGLGVPGPVPAVPEPGTWAMLLLGLGAICSVVGRKNRGDASRKKSRLDRARNSLAA